MHSGCGIGEGEAPNHENHETMLGGVWQVRGEQVSESVSVAQSIGEHELESLDIHLQCIHFTGAGCHVSFRISAESSVQMGSK